MLNTVTLQGRLTADPELRKTASDKSVASFTLAVDRDFGEKETDFIPIVVWGKTAEFAAKYFTKGRMMIVSGRIQIRTYEKNGEKRYVTEVVADKVFFAGDKTKTREKGNSAASMGGLVEMDDDNSDELPF